MRLICPNCDAQYEVDDTVIPEAGRDVQCSNCGHTWFQQPAHLDRELADDLELDTSETEAAGEGALEPEMRVAAEGEAEVTELTAPRGLQAERRALDPSIAEMLREEAAHEVEARQQSAGAFEAQPELGFDEGADAQRRTEAARARMERLRREQDDDVGTIAWEDLAEEEAAERSEGDGAAAASRRDLLPDIDEVDTEPPLAAEPVEEEADQEELDEQAAAQRRGFSGGFLLTLLLVLIAVGVYALAPQIAETLPQAEPYLVVYVDWANAVRTQIDQIVDASVAKIRELINR